MEKTCIDEPLEKGCEVALEPRPLFLRGRIKDLVKECYRLVTLEEQVPDQKSTNVMSNYDMEIMNHMVEALNHFQAINVLKNRFTIGMPTLSERDHGSIAVDER